MFFVGSWKESDDEDKVETRTKGEKVLVVIFVFGSFVHI